TSGRPSSSGSPVSTTGSAGLLRRRRSTVSKSPLAQLPGVALPVLGNLHVEVEVDRGAEQGLDLVPGTGADVAEAGTLVADDDALLRGPLDVQVGVGVEQRLFGRPALAQPHLLDDDGDGVRELVADAVEGGL